MAGEIQIDSVTALTASGSDIILNNVNTATNRTNLGLGSIATQNANAVAITGGSITGTEFDLKSTGTSVYKSDGTTAVISESGGTATIDNATLGSDIYFPTGHIIQMITADTDTEYLSTSTTTYTNIANLRLNITPTRSGSKIIIMLNGISKLGSNSGNIKTEYRFLVNSSAIEYWYGVQFLNTSAIDDEANHVHIMKIYSHGQTSSFSNLQIDFDFRRQGSGNYSDTAFNYDAQGVNYASSYAMEVVG